MANSKYQKQENGKLLNIQTEHNDDDYLVFLSFYLFNMIFDCHIIFVRIRIVVVCIIISKFSIP